MKLVIRRDQDRGLMGGMSFVLEAQAVLSRDEEELIKKYKANREVLCRSEVGVTTVDDLVRGVKTKCKDVSILLNNEAVYKEACGNFKSLLLVMASFGGEEVVEY